MNIHNICSTLPAIPFLLFFFLLTFTSTVYVHSDTGMTEKQTAGQKSYDFQNFRVWGFSASCLVQSFVPIDSLSSPWTLCLVPLSTLNPRHKDTARCSGSTPNWQRYLIQDNFLLLLTELAGSCTQLEGIAAFGCYTIAYERHMYSIRFEVSRKIKRQNSNAVVGKGRNGGGCRHESTGMS